MLTLKLITEQTDLVIKGLEKKHFAGAKEAIAEVIATDKKRREAQTTLDQNLSEAKKMAAEIGGLMKQGKKEEAEAIKAKVSGLKETNEALKQQRRSLQLNFARFPTSPTLKYPRAHAQKTTGLSRATSRNASSARIP